LVLNLTSSPGTRKSSSSTEIVGSLTLLNDSAPVIVPLAVALTFFLCLCCACFLCCWLYQVKSRTRLLAWATLFRSDFWFLSRGSDLGVQRTECGCRRLLLCAVCLFAYLAPHIFGSSVVSYVPGALPQTRFCGLVEICVYCLSVSQFAVEWPEREVLSRRVWARRSRWQSSLCHINDSGCPSEIGERVT
jgi:hypothetical protein